MRRRPTSSGSQPRRPSGIGAMHGPGCTVNSAKTTLDGPTTKRSAIFLRKLIPFTSARRITLWGAQPAENGTRTMTAERTHKERLFHAAAELADQEHRDAFLAAACGGDAALRAEIEEMLQ